MDLRKESPLSKTPSKPLTSPILSYIKQVIQAEKEALEFCLQKINPNYEKAVQLLYQRRKGKIILTGVGKSGIIAKKIAATLTSTGSLAFSLHPTEAMHGDLGILTPSDTLIAISKSGESQEINHLILALKNTTIPIIALTSQKHSTLGRMAHIVIEIPVKKEACPFNLAPTVSTTLTLAIGDAIAIALMKLKKFQPQDFAKLHPSGQLGRKLHLQVKEVMVPLEHCSVLNLTTSTIKDILFGLTQCGLGIVLFMDTSHTLSGILTDGDIRRLLNRYERRIFDLKVDQIINKNPITVEAHLKAIEVLELMEKHTPPLNVVPVMEQQQCIGVARLHDLLTL